MPLTSYRVSEQAKQIARASGFDIENPHQRYPVQNLKIQCVIDRRKAPQERRAELLLKGRQTLGRFLGRERS